MMRLRPIIVKAWMLAVLAAGLAVQPGCKSGEVAGYRANELFDTSVQSVAVPIFANRSFYREVEFNLTEALTKEIESRSPYKVRRTGDADTTLTGTILSVNQRLLSRTLEGGLTQEAQVVITASFEWKDLRTGKILRKRSVIRGTGEYIPTRPVGEPFEVARHAAISELSREIVSVMAGDW